jgi:hypothetical protein
MKIYKFNEQVQGQTQVQTPQVQTQTQSQPQVQPQPQTQSQAQVQPQVQQIKNFSGKKDDVKTYNIKTPSLKLDEITNDVSYANNTHKKVLVTFFKSNVQYIDLLDKKKHIFKINDMSGDIMNNNRSSFNAIIFDDAEIKSVRDNILYYAMGEFYAGLPDMLNIFGVEMKPLSYVDKEELKYVFEQHISFDETVNVITNVSKYHYNGKIQGFHVWSDKK